MIGAINLDNQTQRIDKIYCSTCYSQVQRDFNENLREIKQTFEQILEGEKHIDVAKNQLAVCEHREAKLKKELKKVAKRATMDELNQLEDRLGKRDEPWKFPCYLFTLFCHFLIHNCSRSSRAR